MPNELRHLALIMDGNRRWAKSCGLPTWRGHEQGSEVAYQMAKDCIAKGITHLTMWVLSKENWKRTEDEVGFLMGLIERTINRRLEEFIKLGARLRHLGNPEGLPSSLLATIHAAESASQNNTTLVLNMAINYGGEDELERAKGRLVNKLRKGPIVVVEDILDSQLRDHLDTAGQPNVDLIIRTGGQRRLSGFMPLQTVWSELYFTDTLWPDFTEWELDMAITWFNAQERNFGK